MQDINPIETHTKFGKDRINTFPSNEQKPSVWTADSRRRMAEKAKIICPLPSGVDIIILTRYCLVHALPYYNCNPMQAINPIDTHTKFGKDRINTFPSNERKPSIRTVEKAKIICPPHSLGIA